MYFLVLLALFSACITNYECIDVQSDYRFSYFDTDILRYIAEGRRGNVAVSPASIKLILSMLLQGASGTTAYEISRALRINPDRDIREQLTKSILALQPEESINSTLRNTNIFFVSKNIQVNPGYGNLLNKLYHADIQSLDFTNPFSAADTINSWIFNNTGGLLKDTIDPYSIDSLSSTLIANALYFKSNWLNAFLPDEENASCFYVQGVCVPVPMMETQGEMNYAHVEALNAHAIEIFYENRKYSMVIVMPINRSGMDDLLRDLPYMSLPLLLKQMEPSDVYLTMPKFNIDFNQDMIEVLKKMQITTLFSPAANLSAIFNGISTQIHNVHHRVHLSVDENGTVAAAISSAEIVPLMGGRVVLRIDKPFLFFIKDNRRGVILFEGKVEEPIRVSQKQIPEAKEKSYNNVISQPTLVTTSKPMPVPESVKTVKSQVNDPDIIIFKRFGIIN